MYNIIDLNKTTYFQYNYVRHIDVKSQRS